MDKKTLERIVKAIVAMNKGAEFYKPFLKLFDDMDLIVEEDDKEIRLSLKIK